MMSVDPYANRGGSGSFPPSLQRPSNSSTQQREAQGSPRRGQSPTRNLNSPRRNLPPHLAARSAQFSSSTDEEAAFGGGMMNNTAATAPNYIISTATGAISEEQPPTIPYAHTPGYSYRKESGDMSGSKLSPPTSDGSLSPAEVGVMKSEASRVNAAAHPPQHNVGGAVQAPRGVYMVDVESYLPPSEQRIEEGSLSASSKHPLRLCPQTACPQASSCTPSTLPGGPQFGKNATSLPASCYEAATQRPPGKCSSLISLALALFFMYVTMSLASQALYQTNKTQATMEAERALGIKKGRETIYLPSEMIKLARWTKADCAAKPGAQLNTFWNSILDLWDDALTTGKREKVLPLREAAMRMLRVCRHWNFDTHRYHELADRTVTPIGGHEMAHRGWGTMFDKDLDNLLVHGLFWAIFGGSSVLCFLVAFGLVQAVDRCLMVRLKLWTQSGRYLN